jgi:hypothetical protein
MRAGYPDFWILELEFSPRCFSGAWVLDVFFSNHLKPSPGFSNLLKHPLPPGGEGVLFRGKIKKPNFNQF